MIYIIYQLFWHKTSNLNDTYDNNHLLTISHQEPLIHALLVLQVLFPSDFFNLYVFLIENHVLGCYFDFVLSVLSHKLFSSQYNILFYLFLLEGPFVLFEVNKIKWIKWFWRRLYLQHSAAERYIKSISIVM